MTAPPDVEQHPAVDTAWDERPIVGNARGLPWWAAVLLAFSLAAIAAWFDIHRQDSLGRIYQGAYVLGCVVAVCAVRRRNLFGPMVQPPLIFAITAIGAVVLNQPNGANTGLKSLIFSVALPLTSNFPTMAITTGGTVAIGLARLWFQRNPTPRMRSNRRGDPDPLDLLEGRNSRPARDYDAPPGRRPPRPDRTSRRPRPEDPPPGAAPRQRTGRTPRPTREREPWDQPPPRSARGRTEPPPDRPLRGDRSRATPPQDQRRRQPPDQPPRRRRPDR